MFVSLLDMMLCDAETQKLVETLASFKDYRNKMLIAILGFFANLSCFPKFMESVVAANPKEILHLLCLVLVKVDNSEDVWQRALCVLNEIVEKQPETKLSPNADKSLIATAFKRVSSLCKNPEYRNTADTLFSALI
jgi:hypothetical protein